LKRNSILTVNLDAISHNVEVLQSYLKRGVKQMAVIKANAYGHGAVEVAHKIAPQVDWFAVNDMNEAIELRKSGIEVPLLVFGVPEAETSDLYKRFNLTATISAAPHFHLLSKGTKYHLNFNTGMGRLGFRPEAAEKIADLVKHHPELNCTGIYSHLATADELDSAKTEEQYQLFKEIRANFDSHLLAHLCNTAGVARCSEAQFDMVRTGIGLYGYAPGEVSIPGLKPALTWETYLAQVNSIRKGETVSYGAHWKAPEDGYIGTIPAGYADSIPRGLSGNLNVTIEGNVYPVVGRVTMNYCMIFLGQKPIEAGTNVYLWDEHHNAGDWAAKIQTIPYEIVTNIPAHITRNYQGAISSNSTS
jgi:alanine racemase